MSAGLVVVHPGLYTTLQDTGRYGYQQFGIPVSGALDTESLRLANALIYNESHTAGLEILFQGPTLEVTAESVRIAVAGFGASLAILSPEPETLSGWRSTVLRRGQKFQLVSDGAARASYLAVAGGFAVEPFLGSRSTYARAHLGGFKGRPLREGDELPLNREAASDDGDLQLPNPPASGAEQPIRCTWGLQRTHFTDDALERFVTEPFTVLPESDRMGYRLDGPLLKHRDSHDIISDAIATGAIQVPGNGQPIVLLADHQTTGGYPKIANVISADLPIVGRRRPGDQLRFEIVDVEAAHEILRSRDETIRSLEESIELATNPNEVDLDALYSANLVSGVVSSDGIDD